MRTWSTQDANRSGSDCFRSRASQGRFSPGCDEPHWVAGRCRAAQRLPVGSKNTTPPRSSDANHRAAGNSVWSGGTVPSASCPEGTRSGGRSVGWVVDLGRELGERPALPVDDRLPVRLPESQFRRPTCPAGTTPGAGRVAACGEEEQILVGDPHVARGDLEPELVPQVRRHGAAKPRHAGFPECLGHVRRKPRLEGEGDGVAVPLVEQVGESGRPGRAILLRAFEERGHDPLPPEHVADKHGDIEESGLACPVRPGQDVIPVQVDAERREAAVAVRLQSGDHRLTPGSGYFSRNALYALAISGRSLSTTRTRRWTWLVRSTPRTLICSVSFWSSRMTSPSGRRL